VQWNLPVIIRIATLISKNAGDTLADTSSQWMSTEHQQSINKVFTLCRHPTLILNGLCSRVYQKSYCQPPLKADTLQKIALPPSNLDHSQRVTDKWSCILHIPMVAPFYPQISHLYIHSCQQQDCYRHLRKSSNRPQHFLRMLSMLHFSKLDCIVPVLTLW